MANFMESISVEQIGCKAKTSSLSRYETVVINQLRIGHTRLTNLLKGEDQPECDTCQSHLTVKHFLVDCTDFSAARERYFRVDTLKDLYENVDSRNSIDFFKHINFYHCI